MKSGETFWQQRILRSLETPALQSTLESLGCFHLSKRALFACEARLWRLVASELIILLVNVSLSIANIASIAAIVPLKSVLFPGRFSFLLLLATDVLFLGSFPLGFQLSLVF